MRRPAVLAPNAPHYPLTNVNDALKLLEVTANSALQGNLDAKTVNAIANAVNTGLRALEQGPIQERIDKIEADIEAISTTLTQGRAS